VFWDRTELASSNAPLTPELKNDLDRTAILVAIVSGSYLHPECWCNLEREHFLAGLGSTPEQRAAQRRIFIIQIEEMPVAQWQKAFFPDVKAQVFYEKDADDRVRLPLPGDAKTDQRFLDRVENLAEAIAARLKDMQLNQKDLAEAIATGLEEMQLNQKKVPVDPLRRVFLAECTPGLDNERLKMKLFLEEKGWLVLPESDYDNTNYDVLLERDLRSALAFVQLIGPFPWKRGGFDVRQNEKAKVPLGSTAGKDGPHPRASESP
jgi:hypothetical protein